MKVLHVSSGNLYGGVEALLATLSRERACCPEMEPAFALCFRGRLSDQLAALGTPAADLGRVQTRYPWQIWRARRRLARRLREQPVDVVVCHMAWAQAIFGPVVRRARLPLVFWMHDVANGRHWIERWAARCRPDFVLANSRFTAGSLQKLFPEPPITFETFTNVVSKPEGIFSPAERDAVRAKFGVRSAKEVVVLQISRLERWKGHADHLQALSRLVDLPDWSCWMTGSAQRPQEKTYLAELQASVSALGLDERVHFLGWQPEVDSLLASADIFCQPNPSPEPFGRVFIEALHAGLPVVATDVGGACEIVDETCGRLAPPGDAEAIAALLRELILHPELRGTLGHAGPARAAALTSPPLVLNNLCRVLSGL